MEGSAEVNSLRTYQSQRLPANVLAELQSAAKEYLLPHLVDSIAGMESLPPNSYVLISNAIDPDRPVEETRTGQTLAALASKGFHAFEWPLFGFQVHLRVRHAYKAPLPVRRALMTLLRELNVANRLKSLRLKYWVMGKMPELIIRPWRLDCVAFTPHMSEIFRNIDKAHDILEDAFPHFMALPDFTDAVKSSQVTPLQKKAASATFLKMWKTPSLATKFIAASSVRLKMLHKNPNFKEQHSKRASSNMKVRWMIEKYREAKRKAMLGNRVMQTLWQKQWFIDMKRVWYDDPVNRAMFRENGRRTLAKLRLRPEYLTKISAIHSDRLKHLWASSRETMLGVATLGKQAFLRKLEDPAYYAAFIERKREPVRFNARVQLALEALEQRRGVCKSRYDMAFVESLVRMVAENFPQEGLVEFSWRLMTAQSYADTLLVKLSASKAADQELQPLIQSLRVNVGYGIDEWKANLDVDMVKRMYESNSGFTPAKLAVLNALPTRELDVMHALGITSRKKTSFGGDANQQYGIAEHGLKILTDEFSDIPASRKAHACSSGPGIDTIRQLTARFEGGHDEDGDWFVYESTVVDGKVKGYFCNACRKNIPKSYRIQHSNGVNHKKEVNRLRHDAGAQNGIVSHGL